MGVSWQGVVAGKGVKVLLQLGGWRSGRTQASGGDVSSVELYSSSASSGGSPRLV